MAASKHRASKYRDVALILILGLLLVLAIVPTRESTPRVSPAEEDTKAPAVASSRPESRPKSRSQARDVVSKARAAADAMSRHYTELERTVETLHGDGEDGAKDHAEEAIPRGAIPERQLALPEGIVHPMLPFVVGSEWRYSVSGHKRLIPGEIWTMRVVREPRSSEPGVLEMGFNDNLSLVHVWLDGGSVRIEGLPHIEPVEFFGNKPVDISGEFLPVAARVVKDAVWIQDFVRHVLYRFLDDKGKTHEVLAKARQWDRAQVRGVEPVVVPAGRYDAYRVSWLSRIEIRAEGRPVFKQLTADPYRRESMWIVPNVGFVRRQIEYVGKEVRLISFDLAHYFRPKLDDSGNVDASILGE